MFNANGKQNKTKQSNPKKSRKINKKDPRAIH